MGVWVGMGGVGRLMHAHKYNKKAGKQYTCSFYHLRHSEKCSLPLREPSTEPTRLAPWPVTPSLQS